MFFLPWVPKVLFGLPWLMLQNFTDGVFYLGYALHFRELVDRVGLNYYAVRFSGIFPDAVAFSVFGPEVGLVLVRYGLAGACCVALFVCFQKRYSIGAGVLAAVAWALNPAAIRFLQTAYVDVTAASFLCLGLAVACMPGRGAIGAAGSGVLLSLAFWGHLHAAVALVFCGPLVLLALWEQGTKRAFVLGGWIFAGFLVPALAATAFYFQQFGLWDLTSPTRELLRTLRDGHIPAPKLEWLEVVRQCPFWLSVAPLAIGLVFLPRKRPVSLRLRLRFRGIHRFSAVGRRGEKRVFAFAVLLLFIRPSGVCFSGCGVDWKPVHGRNALEIGGALGRLFMFPRAGNWLEPARRCVDCGGIGSGLVGIVLPAGGSSAS